MIEVIRYDRQPEPRRAKIQEDWRAWLHREGYAPFTTAEVNAAGLALLLEVYRSVIGDSDAPFILYHEPFPAGGLRETLYLLPDEDAMDNMLMRAQVMIATMLSVEARRRTGQSEG